jgi:hypothetical protein
LQNVILQGPEVYSGGKVVALEGNRRPGRKEMLLRRRGRAGPREGKAIAIMNATEPERS